MTTRTATVSVYPHLSLLNIAHYHCERIKGRLAANDNEGIGLESASCVIMLAFTIEGILNVVGSMLVRAWNERWPYERKLKECCEALNIANTASEPFLTLARLKVLRDDIAHPKPTIRKNVAITKPSEVFAHMDPVWQSAYKPEFAIEAFGHVHAFEQMVRKHPGIGEHAFTTHATDIDGPWE